jgi:hypothetical protein
MENLLRFCYWRFYRFVFFKEVKPFIILFYPHFCTTMFLCMEFRSCSSDSNKPEIIENGVQMLKLLSCWCCYQFLVAGVSCTKRKLFSLDSVCYILRPPNGLWHRRLWPGGGDFDPDDSGHNDWILGDLLKGPFFPNGSQMFLQVFSSICDLLELDNTHLYDYSCILFRETRDITV